MSIHKIQKGVAGVLTGVMSLMSLASFSVVGVTVASAASGDIVKSLDSASTYVVLSDGESICRLVSPGHYDMWAMYKSKGVARWSDIMTVDLASYTDSGVCSLRVGSLVRTSADPKVYVILSDGTKRWIDTWDTYVKLGYSSGGIYYVTDDVLGKYTTGANVTATTATSEIREGQVVKYAGDPKVYYVAKSGTSLVKRYITAESAYWANFGINWNAVLTVPSTETYSDGSDVSGADTSLNRPVSKGTAVVPTGDVTVSLAGTTRASSTLVEEEGITSLASFTFTAGSGAVKVTQLRVKRTGISTDTTLSAVYLYDGMTRVSDNVTFSSNYLTFNESAGLFTVPAGGSKTITVRGNVANTTSGQTLGVMVEAAADITSDATSVGGSFPISGNTHTIAAEDGSTLSDITVGSITPSADATPNPGETDLSMWKTTLTISNKNTFLY